MGKHLFQLRFYEDADYEMISDWFDAHGAEAPPQAILPKLGVICTKNGEDVAAIWLYMDNSVGVCWAEYAVTRPKSSVKEATAALTHLFVYLKQAARLMDYGLMRVNTLPAIAKGLKKHNFIQDKRQLVSLYGTTAE